MPHKKPKAGDAEKTCEKPAEEVKDTRPDENADSPPKADPPAEEANAAETEAALDERYLRLNAEYVNFRNRTAREKEALWTTVKLETATQFLPVLDNLERALQSETEDSSLRQGVDMILRQCREILGKMGAEEIEALGKPFDPKVMDAVMHVEDENLGENTVQQVYTKGYIMGDRVMRHAVVVVAN